MSDDQAIDPPGVPDISGCGEDGWCGCDECNVDATISHTTGYKDDYLVEIRFSEHTNTWYPHNDKIFEFVDLWFQSEDHEFGDGYGRWMPFFYIGLIAIGETEKALEAYQKRGYDAVTYFEDCVQEHGDDIIEHIERLQEETE